MAFNMGMVRIGWDLLERRLFGDSTSTTLLAVSRVIIHCTTSSFSVLLSLCVFRAVLARLDER
jgi:hypothetical protein